MPLSYEIWKSNDVFLTNRGKQNSRSEIFGGESAKLKLRPPSDVRGRKCLSKKSPEGEKETAKIFSKIALLTMITITFVQGRPPPPVISIM